MTRRELLVAGSLLPAAFLLAGCPASESANTAGSPTPASSAASSASPAPAGKKIKAGLVTDVGGIDDKSFNASAWEGLQRANKELGAEIKYTESKSNADYQANLSRYAQNGYDLVFAVGFLMQDAVKDVAARYPNVKFAIIDGDAPNAPNAVSVKFREEEGSFLVGALAGLMTKKNTVGFVGGMEMPLIEKFEAAYSAGVKTTNPKASVKVGYAGRFDDPQKGRELALSQIDANADIIYQAAGKSGLGVIKAIESKGPGYYAIGVDRDQDGEAPGRILTSMVKRVDVAVFDVCKKVSLDSFTPGSINIGIKEEGIGLSPMTYTKKDVPAEALTRIETLRKGIVDGTIKAPTSRKELANFTPPK